MAKNTHIIIGANGQVSLILIRHLANTRLNPWGTAGPFAPFNGVPGYNNCIMAPYHDIDPSVFLRIKFTWGIYGTAPRRYMVISWDSIPMFSCNNFLASQQVVLFESTYLIDINVKEKTLCANWNSGVAHEGIQNANGTVAFMVPGRNGTQFTLNNDAYRFTPAGVQTLNYSVTWKDAISGLVLGTGNTLSYFPTNPPRIIMICRLSRL
ncbi:MAG: hypothetical protein IPJ31_12780 [Bacteroidetes bacterium]|nr:hypothetical protein [Bacteroidota bacterium]